MRRARILTALFLVMGLTLYFTACTEKVSETPIDTEYIAAYDAQEVVYEYKFDVTLGDFRLLPFYKQVHYDEVYKVQYRITYSDGTNYTEWRTVDKPEYDAARAVLEEGGEGQ